MIKLEVLEQLSHSFVRVITWFRVQFGMNQQYVFFEKSTSAYLSTWAAQAHVSKKKASD